MSEQFKLFDLPPDSPSRAAKLRAFKKVNGILTHRYDDGGTGERDVRWLAIMIPEKRADNGGPIPPEWKIFDHLAHYSRLLDEQGFTAYAPTEVGSIRELCRKRGLDCPL